MTTGIDQTPTIEEALHTRLEAEVDPAVDFAQLEHELAGFETVAVTRLDRSIEGAFDEEIPSTALIVNCRPEIARKALSIDRRLAALLPCTTAGYEESGDPCVHVRHVSTTTAIRVLGAARGAEAAVEQLVALTGEYTTAVWEQIESSEAAVS